MEERLHAERVFHRLLLQLTGACLSRVIALPLNRYTAIAVYRSVDITALTVPWHVTRPRRSVYKRRARRCDYKALPSRVRSRVRRV